MTDTDPDAPEELIHYQKRHMWGPTGHIPDDWDGEDRKIYARTLAIEWRQVERQKAIRRNEKARRERELKQLDQQIERAKEREQREAERKRERAEEQERRNPTPVIHPSTHQISIPYDIRDQHIYVPGGTRRGKSSQLLRIIMSDIENGQGVAVLDPKGDLIRSICFELPNERVVNGETRAIIDDCIYLDLDTPVPLDFMDHTPQETNDLINNLVYVVTKGDLRLFEPPGRSSLFSSRTDQDV